MSNNKQLPLPPRSSRHCPGISQCHHAQFTDSQALLREIEALKAEKAQLLGRIGNLTNEIEKLREEHAQDDVLRQVVEDYKESL